MLKELIDFFSVSTSGDAPLGLNVVHNITKQSRPCVQHQQYYYSDLFNQTKEPVYYIENERLTHYDCGMQWLTTINKYNT